MPICALIDNTLFCVHGGLSPKIENIDQILDLDRAKEVESTGPMTDLLWSDPNEKIADEWAASSRYHGFEYGAGAVSKFFHTNDLDLICRAHQLCEKGFHYFFNETVLNVWSAPNYMYRFDNKACVFKFNNQERFPIFYDASADTKIKMEKKKIAYFLSEDDNDHSCDIVNFGNE